MGRGSDSTLRIDEPLHFMFLVAYLITYFCCAYLLFVCFKHCRRIWKRKPSRPSRIRNVAELVNNFHARQAVLRVPRQIQVSINDQGVCSQLFGERNAENEERMEESSISDEETNTSRISPFVSPLPRIGGEMCLMEELPSYESISSEDEESPPPSYNDCVLNPLQDNKPSHLLTSIV